MRALVQRVSSASVTVEGEVVGAIGPGLLVFACAMAGDEAADVVWLADKLRALRVFADAEGRMNLAVADGDVARGLLVVSQFTLSADLAPGLSKGNRPAFTSAMTPAPAAAMVGELVQHLRDRGLRVETGRFGAHMTVQLVNDGPVTLWLDTRAGRGAAGARPQERP